MTNTTSYTIEEAIKLMKEEKKRNFDPTVEIHINLDLDVKQANQQLRYTVVLPKGTGKKVKIAVLSIGKYPEADIELSEQDIQKIETGSLKPKVDFDVIITEPGFMPKIAKAAKILGPLGMMPNPKTGTVTNNIALAIEEVKKGKVEVRTEKDAPLVHTIVGKLSFSEADLTENISSVISSLKANRPSKVKPDWIKGIAVCSSMGRSYQLKFSGE